MKKTDVIEKLYNLITNPILMSYEWIRKCPSPGQLLDRFKDVREACKELSSDDIKNLRFNKLLVEPDTYLNKQFKLVENGLERIRNDKAKRK